MSTTIEELEERVKKLESKSGSEKVLTKQFSSVGNISSDFLIKTHGNVKIQVNRKFIDLVKGGVLAVDTGCIYEADEVGTSDGIYVIGEGDDVSVVLKVGDQEITLVGEVGTTYVSFVGEQETTAEMKYQALTNIGFIYATLDDVDADALQNGIIYVESTQKLYIVENGVLTEYTVEFPNPYTEQFVIAKDDDSEGALIIEGDGEENSIVMGDTFMLYVDDGDTYFNSDGNYYFQIGDKTYVTISKNSVTFENDVISNYFGSVDASSTYGFRLYMLNGESYLEVDNLIVRNSDDEDEEQEEEEDEDMCHPYPTWWFYDNNAIDSCTATTGWTATESDDDEEEDEDDEEEETDPTLANDATSYTLTLQYANSFSIADILYAYIVQDNDFKIVAFQVTGTTIQYDTDGYEFTIYQSDSGTYALAYGEQLYFSETQTDDDGNEYLAFVLDSDDWEETSKSTVTINDEEYDLVDSYTIKAADDSGYSFDGYIEIVIGDDVIRFTIDSDVETKDCVVCTLLTSLDITAVELAEQLQNIWIFKVANEDGDEPILSIGPNIDIKYSSSVDDVEDETNSLVRIGVLDTLEKNRIDNTLESGIEAITGIGVYANELVALEAQYEEGYELPKSDNSSRFASTEWVCNKIVQAGYYYSTTSVDDEDEEPENPTYIGTTLDDYEGVSEEVPYVWYTNDGEEWTLIEKYIEPDDDYYYIATTSYISLNYTEDGVSYNGNYPGGFMAIVTDSGDTEYYTFYLTSSLSGARKGKMYNDVDDVSGLTASNSASLYLTTPTSNDESEDYFDLVMMFLDETEAGQVPSLTGFYYIWQISKDAVESGSITWDDIELVQTTGAASTSLDNDLAYTTAGMINTFDSGKYWCTTNEDGYIVYNGTAYDELGDTSEEYNEDGSLNVHYSSYRAGTVYYRWADIGWLKRWISNVMAIMYVNNKSLYSSTFNRLIINTMTSYTLHCGYGGSITISCWTNSEPTFYTDYMFMPSVNITARLIWNYNIVDVSVYHANIGAIDKTVGQANSSYFSGTTSKAQYTNRFMEVGTIEQAWIHFTRMYNYTSKYNDENDDTTGTREYYIYHKFDAETDTEDDYQAAIVRVDGHDLIRTQQGSFQTT